MEKKQIDQILGGSYVLSGRITLMEFLAARAPELAALNRAIENVSRAKSTNSTNLPMHMRRTLMSHNQNQLPRRVLEAIKKEKAKKFTSQQVHHSIKSKTKQKKKRRKKNSSNKPCDEAK